MEKATRNEAALGRIKADLVLKNGNLVDVLGGRILQTDVAVTDGIIVGLGCYEGRTEVDCTDRYIAPGYINCHCHIESVLVTPDIYAMEEARWGTTTIITDPHEIANVAGALGLDYMLGYREGMPVDYYLQVPSCVPAGPFEDAGATLTAQDLAPYLDRPGVLGLGEMMDVHGVLTRDEQVWDKLERYRERVIDGHSPGLGGNELNAYILAGPSTDHESSSFEEAIEKVTKGMGVLVRQGSASRNLADILTPFAAMGLDTTNLAFCTDDKHLADIMREGTISACVGLAIGLGIPPVKAIQMATINAARMYGLRGRGAVAVGRSADLVVLDRLTDTQPGQVYKDGRLIAENGSYIGPVPPSHPTPEALAASVRLPSLTAGSFALPKASRYPVISLVPGQILTQLQEITAEELPGALLSGDLCKIALIERHRASGRMAVGLLRGYGLRQGAVACTVSHDSHNLLVAGVDNQDMLTAARHLAQIQGGYALAVGGQIVGDLPLPIGGLMNNLAAVQMEERIASLAESLHQAGVGEGIDPITTLSFVALTVIPEVRMTDQGVFDVEKRIYL